MQRAGIVYHNNNDSWNWKSFAPRHDFLINTKSYNPVTQTIEHIDYYFSKISLVRYSYL